MLAFLIGLFRSTAGYIFFSKRLCSHAFNSEEYQTQSSSIFQNVLNKGLKRTCVKCLIDRSYEQMSGTLKYQSVHPQLKTFSLILKVKTKAAKSVFAFKAFVLQQKFQVAFANKTETFFNYSCLLSN